MPDHTPVTTDDVTFGIRDRLLLAFAELEMYGIETQAGGRGRSRASPGGDHGAAGLTARPGPRPGMLLVG